MAIQIEQQWDEATTDQNLLDKSSTATLKFFAFGAPTDTEYDVRLALQVFAPPTYDGLILATVGTIRRVKDDSEGKVWECQATYKNQEDQPQQPPQDESTVVMEIRSGAGSTSNKILSKALVQERFNPATSLTFAGFTVYERLLGLKLADSDSGASFVAQGIPFPSGDSKIILHIWRSLQTMNNGYLLKLMDAAERQVVNSTQWNIFPKGSLLFEEFQALQKAGQNAGFEITLTFDYKKAVRPEIPGLPPFTVDKLGHQYLDVLFAPELVAIVNIVMSRPQRACIHDIFDQENFSQLFGI